MSEEQANRKALGTRLRRAREYLRLSQEDAGHVLGLTRTAITKIESGTRKVDAMELAEFAKLYRQPVSVLSGEEGVEPLPDSIKALARTASKLSDKDQVALMNFAHFLSGKPPDPDDGE